MSKHAPLICVLIGIGFVITPALWRLACREVPDPSLRFETRWRLPVPSRVDSLNPNAVTTQIEKNYLLLLFGRLVRQNSVLELEPDALDSWSYHIQASTYLFKLKPNVVFHDGSELNSQDVIFSFHEWVSHAPDHPILNAILGVKPYIEGKASHIEGIEAINQKEFKVQLIQWVDNFVPALANPQFVLYPDKLDGQTHETFFLRPNGTGPYRVSSFQPGRLEVASHEKYYKGRPNTPVIELYHEDTDRARAEFAAGKINNLLLYDIADPDAFSGPGVKVIPQNKQTTHALVLSNTHALGRMAWRARVAEAIDKEALLDCFPGTRLANRLIPSGAPLTDLPPAQPSTKKKGSRRTRLTLTLSHGEQDDCLRPILQRQLEEIGVNVIEAATRTRATTSPTPADLQVHSFDFFREDLAHNLQFLDSRSPQYLFGAPIPHLQELLLAITPVMSSTDVLRAHDNLDAFLVFDHRVIPLSHSNHFSVFRDELKNAELLASPRFVANWNEIRILKEPDAN